MEGSSRQAFVVRSGAAPLAAEATGAGEPVVCLHAGVCDRRMWRSLGAALAQRAAVRVVAYDRRGFGDTPAVDEARSHVDDLCAVLAHPSVGAPAVLVGCSQGGRIAIDLALRAPELVRALVLVAPAISGAPEPDSLPAAAQALADAIDAAERASDVDRVNALEVRAWLDGPLEPEGRVGGELRALVLAMNGIALRAPPMSSLLSPPGAWDRLASIAAPTLVVWGDRDFPHVQRNCRHLVAQIRGAVAAVVVGTAHLPTMEQPEACAELVARLLDRIGPPAAP